MQTSKLKNPYQTIQLIIQKSKVVGFFTSAEVAERIGEAV